MNVRVRTDSRTANLAAPAPSEEVPAVEEVTRLVFEVWRAMQEEYSRHTNGTVLANNHLNIP
ncbi:MAG TPA: hypothetical protein VET26_11605, partial [Candidatus Sulfotelmatobacter sp.]|nr:hypothetical protein [Candidatus Sulfotelmatobacter sp.]